MTTTRCYARRELAMLRRYIDHSAARDDRLARSRSWWEGKHLTRFCVALGSCSLGGEGQEAVKQEGYRKSEKDTE